MQYYFIITMGSLRKRCPEISWGSRKLLKTDAAPVIAMQYDWNGTSLITIHNFSNEPQQIKLRFHDKPKSLQNLLNNSALRGENIFHLKIDGYGYSWYRMNK